MRAKTKRDGVCGERELPPTCLCLEANTKTLEDIDRPYSVESRQKPLFSLVDGKSSKRGYFQRVYNLSAFFLGKYGSLKCAPKRQKLTFYYEYLW